MNSKIIGGVVVIAVIIVSSSIVFSQQKVESENNFQAYIVRFDDFEWNNEVTRILPREGDLGREWTLMWSDATEEFAQTEYPIIVRKTIAGNEILLTSYSYVHEVYGTYQILIWKGELVSNWNPNEAVENIFLQTDANIEKILDDFSLNSNCVAAYYDYYGDEMEIKNDLLFSECAKNDFRIRVNLVEGEYSQDAINKLIFFSNLTVGKI